MFFTFLPLMMPTQSIYGTLRYQLPTTFIRHGCSATSRRFTAQPYFILWALRAWNFLNTGTCVQAPIPVLGNSMAKLVSEVVKCRIHINHGKHDGGEKDADDAGEDDDNHRFHGGH